MLPGLIKKGVKFYVDSSSVLQFIFLIVLIALSAFFSSAETALTTVNRVRVRTLIDEGNRRAAVLQKVLDNYSKMLSSILIGNNVVNLSASALTTTLAMKLWGNYAVSIATGVLTLVVLLCGEIVPKNAATLNAEKYPWLTPHHLLSDEAADAADLYCGSAFRRHHDPAACGSE